MAGRKLTSVDALRQEAHFGIKSPIWFFFLSVLFFFVEQQGKKFVEAIKHF
jgi:hypothetical protein